MPIVNYVREHMAFIEYAADNGLRPNEILVWESLFHIMNQRANGNYWPDGFIRVKNDRILTYAPIGFDSLSRARNALMQRGLISYKPGKRNSDVPMYELHYLTAPGYQQMHDEPVDNSVDNFGYPGFCPQFADNMGGNMGGNMQGNMGGNMQGNMGGNIRGNMGGNIRGNMGYQYINLNNTEQKINKTRIDDDDDDDEEASRAYAQGRQDREPDEEWASADTALAAVAARAVSECFGRRATPAEAMSMAVCARLSGFGADMLTKAVEIAARHGARIPGAYIRRIFDEWRIECVTTPAEADEYQCMADARDGRNDLGSGDVMEDYHRMQEARDRRRAQHEDGRT